MTSVEESIKNAIISQLNADTTTRDIKTNPSATSKIRAWEQQVPEDTERNIRYPYGYVTFTGQEDVGSSILNYRYDFHFEIGIIQRTQKEVTAEDFVLDLMDKVETVIKKDWTLGTVTQNISSPVLRSMVDTGSNGLSWVIILVHFRKKKVARDSS